MDFAAFMETLLSYDAVSLILALPTFAVTLLLKNVIKNERLFSVLPFLVGTVFYTVYLLIFSPAALTVSSAITGGMLVGSLAFVGKAVALGVSDKKLSLSSVEQAAVYSVLSAMGVGAEHASKEIVSVFRAFSSDDKPEGTLTDSVLEILKTDFPDKSEGDLKETATLVQDVLNSLKK